MEQLIRFAGIFLNIISYLFLVFIVIMFVDNLKIIAKKNLKDFKEIFIILFLLSFFIAIQYTRLPIILFGIDIGSIINIIVTLFIYFFFVVLFLRLKKIILSRKKDIEKKP